MPIISYLISYRNSSPERAANLRYVLSALATLDQLEIILIEQDSKPTCEAMSLPDNCQYQFAYNPGLFNKSWGLNLATGIAGSDRFIFGDADMLLSRESYQRILSSLGSDADAINPYSNLVDLGEAQTRALLQGEQHIDIESGHAPGREHKGQHAPFCGGVFAITRRLFQRCGGMDQRFQGWGGEDDAMSLRIERFATNRLILEDQSGYHLWHPSEYTVPEQNPYYLHNLARLTAYYEFGEDFYQDIAVHDSQSPARLDKYMPEKGSPLTSIQPPLISCLCVTRNRVEALKQVITCFNQQSHPERELLIVYEQDDFATQTFLQTIQQADIRSLSVSIKPKLTLGALRNRAIEAARGQYICQWDDDDWYHPRRLELQLKAAFDQGKPGSILPRWLIYVRQTQAAYCSNIRLWEGSLLCERACLLAGPGYSEISKGEDTTLIADLYIKDQLAIDDRPDLYVYIHSGNNTWDDQHFKQIIQASQQLPARETEKLKTLIASTDQA